MPELTKSIFFFLPAMVLGAAAHAAEPQLNSSPTAVSETLPAQPMAAAATARHADTDKSQDAVIEYQNSIKQLQATHGAFYDQISEKLIGMGLAYRNLGQNKQAVDAFNRSLHINRINHGLYDASQLPILELIIQTNTTLADWQALDQNYHYLYWVNRRIYGDDSPRLLPVINRLGQWHLQAYSLAVDSLPFNHLLDAEQLFQDAIQIIEKNYGADDPRLITPLYGLTMTNFQISSNATAAAVYDHMRVATLNSGFMDQMLEDERNRQDMISESYRDGKKALLKIVDIYSKNTDLPVTGHGMALVMLGDWYLLFNRRSAAVETYAEAYSSLQKSGMQNEEIDRIFGKPHSIPELEPSTDLQTQQNNSNDIEDVNYVIAKFDVSKSGWARNIEIVEANPADNVSLRRRAKDRIRATRFRPRLENGQPVATAGVNVKYIDIDHD